jgi:hypothetical protein
MSASASAALLGSLLSANEHTTLIGIRLSLPAAAAPGCFGLGRLGWARGLRGLRRLLELLLPTGAQRGGATAAPPAAPDASSASVGVTSAGQSLCFDASSGSSVPTKEDVMKNLYRIYTEFRRNSDKFRRNSDLSRQNLDKIWMQFRHNLEEILMKFR